MSYPLKYSKLDYSLIRWVNDLSGFEEINNPQNNQFFGVSKYDTDKRNHYSDFAYPLLNKDGYHWDGIHRLVIVEQNDNNNYTGELSVWYVSGSKEIQLPSFVNNDYSNIFYITIFAEGLTGCGHLEIRNETQTYKYSDKIKFVSNLPYVSVHTKNQYNRDGFNWESSPENNWIVTNLPAECIGLTEIVPEREIEYINQASPSLTQTKNDKQISIEFNTNGKASVLDSIESLSGNLGNGSGFYLNRVKVVPNADIDRDEENINSTGTFLYQYNEDYSLIEVDDNTIFSDLKPIIQTLQPQDESNFTEGLDNNFELTVTYNIPIQLTTDLSKQIRIYQDNVLIDTLTANDVLSVVGTSLFIKPSLVYPIGEYRIEIDDSFVLENVIGQFGAVELNDWNFSVIEPRVYNDNYSDVYS